MEEQDFAEALHASARLIFDLVNEVPASVLDAFRKNTDFPLHTDKVLHAYESTKVGDVEHCPRCGEALGRRYSIAIFDTEEGNNILMGPVADFCEMCPTAVIDDDFLQDLLKAQHLYYGVFSLTSTETFEPFETMNGETAHYIAMGRVALGLRLARC